jgi:DoxX-like family
VEEFGLIGADQWLRYLVGTDELAGGIGLLTPWLAGLAAVGLAADMAGATIINATVLHNTTYGPNVWITMILCAVFVLLAYGRRRQIKSYSVSTDREFLADGHEISTRGREKLTGRTVFPRRARVNRAHQVPLRARWCTAEAAPDEVRLRELNLDKYFRTSPDPVVHGRRYRKFDGGAVSGATVLATEAFPEANM